MDLPAEPGPLLDELCVRIYKEPLQTRWADRRQLPDVVRTVALLIDLDTELHMNGLAGLIENSTGEFLPEMISALEDIGAPKTAQALLSVRQIMATHGITHAMLRGDFADLEQFEITSFEQLHGEATAAMLREIGSAVSPLLYLHGGADENPMALLESYVAVHETVLRALTTEALGSEPG